MVNFAISSARVIVFGSGIYHLVMGAACLLSRRQISYLMKLLYRIEFPEKWDPLAEYSIKPLGAFAIFTSMACFTALRHPDGVLPCIEFGLAILFALRASFRYFYRDLFAQVMRTPWSRSRWNVAFNLILTLVLLASAAASVV